MSRRRRRGEPVGAPPQEQVELPDTLDPAVFRQVDDTLWAFANRRLRPVVDAVGAAFLGPSHAPERKLPEIQLALRAYATLGWSDAQGRRIIDMFAAHGVDLPLEQEQALQSLRQGAFGLYAIEEIDGHDMTAHDFMRQESFTLRDQNAAASVEPGDLLLAWAVPSAKAWHPVGAATLVPASHRAVVEAGLRELAVSMETSLSDLPSTHPVHVFWTVFRLVNAFRPAQSS
jgi:hypothetical protein